MKLRLAILDLYNGTPNQGMRCIREIIARYGDAFETQLFDVRAKAAVPAIEDFDIFISTGGPGNPLEGDGIWDAKYHAFLDALWDWNAQANYPKKYAFLICHSFQIACHHFDLGQVNKRKSKSFGTFPVHKTEAGAIEAIFDSLDDPFWAADFRDYQVVQANKAQLEAMGAQVLALEKIRPHVPLERAIMGIRFSEEIIGVQFHPEADADGMLLHFQDEKRKQNILEQYGEAKYHSMIRDLKDPEKIEKTNNTILPNFLNFAIAALQGVEEAVC